MKLLFLKHRLAWPRATGHDVYTFHTIRALANLGHSVTLATTSDPQPEAIEGIEHVAIRNLDHSAPGAPVPTSTWLQGRFRSFWGVSDRRLAALGQLVDETRPDALVVVGMDVLPYLVGVTSTTTVWFAADELVRHHLSQVRLFRAATWVNLRDAAFKGLYERAHVRAMDRVWVVSDQERSAMRRWAGVRQADVVPLGVDTEYFAPNGTAATPKTAVFWGRLDFGPNVQALNWFLGRVWPLVRQAHPTALLTIAGFSPCDEVRRLAETDGVRLVPDVNDLRHLARQHAVAVLPFVSGGGAKNKLLEAAAMGIPITCTPLATQGLLADGEFPFRIAATPPEMAAALDDWWRNDASRQRIGELTRAWVVANHSWTATARRVESLLAPGATS